MFDVRVAPTKLPDMAASAADLRQGARMPDNHTDDCPDS
jgi:hypothetical protein